MSANTLKQSQAIVKDALANNPQFLAEALDCYKQIKGDIRDYIHGPLQLKEYKNRMAGYGKLIGAWRNFLVTIQLSTENKGIDHLLKSIPKLEVEK